MSNQTITRPGRTLQIAASVFLVSILALFYPATISTLQAQTPTKPSASAPGGPREGIKVHGHWTIEVRNPDGTLATRREFENALTPDGGEQLVRMLMRTRKAGEWQIVLKGGSVDSPCVINNAAPEGCFIVEPSSYVNIGYLNFFKTLTLEAQGLGAQSRAVLHGTMTANRVGTIDSVATSLVVCSVDSPGLCPSGSQRNTFTSTSISPVVNVANGQIVQVTVTLSFS